MEGMFQQFRLKMDTYCADSLSYVGRPAMLDQTQKELFVGLLIYWDMYLSFMSTETSGQEASHLLYGMFQSQPSENSQLLNPWTGISTEIIILTTLVGKLFRQVRGRQYQRFAPAVHDAMEDAFDLERTYELEQRLLSVDTKADIQRYVTDPQEEGTSMEELARLAENYRLAALLHFYRGFPQLDANNVARAPH